MPSALAHPIPEAALATHLAILGMTGAGKSYASRSTVERILAAGERACIVDPTGVWWGLRLAADGKSASDFPVAVVGGRRGDLPLDPDSGAALAGVVGRSSTPLILDVSGLNTAGRTRFFTAFAEALLIENVGPLHLVLDEAHLFAPQGRVPDPASAMMLHATNNLVALGRARGLRITLISQRAAKLHKDALTQVSTLVAMKLVAPQDRKAVEAWIGDQGDRHHGVEVLRTLPELQTGEGWVWAPAQGVLARAAFPRIATFDSMAAPVSAGAATGLPPIDLEAIRAALSAAAVPSAPAPSKGRGGKPSAAPPVPQQLIDEAEQRGYERGYQTGARHAAAEARMALISIQARIADFERRLADPSFYCDESFGDRLPEVPAYSTPPGVASSDPAPAPEEEEAPSAITPAQQRVLDMLAWFRAIGVEPVERSVVCVMVGLSPKASTFGVYVAALARAGTVETVVPGMLRLTEDGAAIAAPPSIANKPGAILRAACDQLKPQARRLMELIADAHPEPVQRADLADALGLSRTASTLGVYLMDLSSRGFIKVAGPGQVRAADFLFGRTTPRRKSAARRKDRTDV